MTEEPEVIVRPARLSDAPRIFSLIDAHSDLLVPRSIGDIVCSIDRFVLAEVDGVTVGCASYQIHPEIGAPEAATVELQSVAVEAAYRRRGVGRRLIESLLPVAARFGAKEVLVLTFAPEFFSSLGFREIPKTKVMHKLYTGCINCTKHTDPFTCPEKAMIRAIFSST